MGKVNLSIGTVVDEKQSESNYEYWRSCLRNYLIGKGLWNIVSGKEANPEDKNDERYESWKQKNAKALHAIQISCGANVYDTVAKKTNSASEAWNLLARKFKKGLQLPPTDDEESTTESRTSSTETGCNFLHYKELWEVVNGGDWKAVQSFLEREPCAINARISAKGDTALHEAILAGHAGIAKALVEKMEPEDVELRNDFKWAPLALAAMSGHIELAKAIVAKNAKVTTTGSGVGGFIPVIHASLYSQGDMVRYLYSETPTEILSPEDVTSGPLLLNTLISSEIYDVALDLLQCNPRLGITKDYYGNYAFRLLARKPPAFHSGCKLPFWKRWIYSSIQIPPIDATKHSGVPFRGPVDEESNGRPQNGSANGGVNIITRVLQVSGGLVWNLMKCLVPGTKHVYDRKLVHNEVLMILRCILKELPALSESKLKEIDFNQAMCDAVEYGIVEFFIELVRFMPEMIWRVDRKGRSIFANAIVERQENIFCLVYGLGTRKSMLARQHDKFANNFLHLAAKLSPPSQLDHVSGAAMQMQRELHWFKEVEGLVQPKYKDEVNDYGMTPSALFSEEHRGLMKEGERWMKNTAASCMVVATLIAAVMFTTTFTPPGGSDDTGMPIFLGNDAFMVFIVSNALSLFSSSTSMLVFLGILTSRYAEEDFLKELPTKLGIGIFSLFFSIMTMMAAFGAALFVILHKRLTWVSMPIVFLAIVPTSIFAMLEFPLLIMMFTNTYGRGIFDRSPKRRY